MVCAVPTISSAVATVASSTAQRSAGAHDVVAVAEHAVAFDPHAVEIDVRVPPAAVECVHPPGARRGGGHDHGPDTGVARGAGLARDDDELVDHVAFDHEPLLARQDGVRPVDDDRGRDRGGIERAAASR